MKKRFWIAGFTLVFMLCCFGFAAAFAEDENTFTAVSVSAIGKTGDTYYVHVDLNEEATNAGTYLGELKDKILLNGNALSSYGSALAMWQESSGETQGEYFIGLPDDTANGFRNDGRDVLMISAGARSDSGKELETNRAFLIGGTADKEIVPTEVTGIAENTISNADRLGMHARFTEDGNNTYAAEVKSRLYINGELLSEASSSAGLWFEGSNAKDLMIEWKYDDIGIKNDRTDSLTIPAGTQINVKDGKDVRTWKDQTFYYYEGSWHTEAVEQETEFRVMSFEQTGTDTVSSLNLYFNLMYETQITGTGEVQLAEVDEFASKILINGVAVNDIDGAAIYTWSQENRLEIQIPATYEGLKWSGANSIEVESGLSFPDEVLGASRLGVVLQEEFSAYFNPSLPVNQATTSEVITAEIGDAYFDVNNFVVKITFKKDGQVVSGKGVTHAPVANLHRNFVKIDGVSIDALNKQNSDVNCWYGGDGTLEIHLNFTAFAETIAPSFTVEVSDGYMLVGGERTVGDGFEHDYIGMVTTAVTKDISLTTFSATGNTGDVFTKDLEITVSYDPFDTSMVKVAFPSQGYNLVMNNSGNNQMKQMILINGKTLQEINDKSTELGLSFGCFFNDGGSTVPGDYEISLSAGLPDGYKLKGDGTDVITVKRGFPVFTVNKAEGKETFLGMLDQEYEYTWAGVLQVKEYLTELDVTRVEMGESPDSFLFAINFDRPVCYGYMPHVNAPVEWLRGVISQNPAPFYYSEADLLYISQNGVQNAINNYIEVGGITLGEYNGNDPAHYPVAIIANYGSGSAYSLQISFRYDMEGAPDWTQEQTLTLKAGFVTPLGGKLDEDISFRYDPATEKWTEVA